MISEEKTNTNNKQYTTSLIIPRNCDAESLFIIYSSFRSILIIYLKLKLNRSEARKYKQQCLRNC